MDLVVDPTGRVRCVYDEAIDLAAIGPLSIARASHVEPDVAGRWVADLAPVGGPALGPFPRRSEALAAERAWLEENWPTAPPTRSRPPARPDAGPGRHTHAPARAPRPRRAYARAGPGPRATPPRAENAP